MSKLEQAGEKRTTSPGRASTLAARTADNGETLVYIVSDNNFNRLQRTLLLMFALTE